MFDFSEKVVIVTGASGNLGQAVARAFYAAKATLVLVDYQTGRMEKQFPALAASGDHYLAEGLDAGEPEAMEGLAREVVRRFGRIDVLANTVGGYWGEAPLYETSLEVWERMLRLNARPVLVTSRAVVPTMLAQGSGKIVHVAARAALKGGARMGPYSAAKSAVVRLVESLSTEVKAGGINVNCVLPGTIDTPQNRAGMPKADHSRWVAPEAIADAILFLASDFARAVHGAALPVYGLS